MALAVADNQFVHKRQVLMVIDPTDYAISARLAEAGVQQAKADMQNAQREAKRQQDLPPAATTIEEQQTYETHAIAAQAQYQRALANLNQAQVNLRRTVIRSPVNGLLTNLLTQRGDYANVGQSVISVSHTDSF